MTEMQIAYRNYQETVRHNKAQEEQARAQLAESYRHSMAQETAAFETNRINDSHYRRSDAINAQHYERLDYETNRHNVVNEFETMRHNQYGERETTRHNEATETQAMTEWYEDKRHNKTVEFETSRHNVRQEQTIPSEVEYNQARTNLVNIDAKTQNAKNISDVVHNYADSVSKLVTSGANLMKAVKQSFRNQKKH